MDAPARRLWTLVEPLHAITYFAPEARQAFEDAGLRGFWRGYFAGRAAPLGPVEAAVVTALFYGFHPDFVARAVPDVWSRCPPAPTIEARLAGVDAALRRLWADDLDAGRLGRAAAILEEACAASPADRRALFAANAALEWPDELHLRLWHACTLLREHRGDGHVVALVAHELDPCEAHVVRIAASGEPVSSIQPYRGWSDEDWSAATARLADRGLLDGHQRPTPAGQDLRASVEDLTDRLARAPARAIETRLDELADHLRPLIGRLDAAGVVPYPNPMGVPRPAR